MSVCQDQAFLAGKVLLIFKKKAAAFNISEVGAFPRLVIVGRVFRSEYSQHLRLDYRVELGLAEGPGCRENGDKAQNDQTVLHADKLLALWRRRLGIAYGWAQ